MTISGSGRVTATNIVSQSYANIYNLINNRTNVPDPADSSGIRKFIHQRIPHTGRNMLNRPFPFIVVQRQKPSQDTSVVSISKSFVNFNTVIIVFCQDKSSDSEGNPSGAEQCETITDDIIETLNNSTNRKTLISQGMAHLRYDVDIEDEEDFDGKTVFTSEFDIRFINNLTAIS